MASTWPDLGPQDGPKLGQQSLRNRYKNGLRSDVGSRADFGPILGRFWYDFWSILGRIWDDVSLIFWVDFCYFFHCIITYLLPTYYQLITYLLLTYYSLGSLFGRFLIDFYEGWSEGFCAESFVDFRVKSEPNRTE